MLDEPLAAQAMQRIQDHIDACAHNYTAMGDKFAEVGESLKSTNRLLMTFIGGVVAVVVTFAGYTYVQSQTLANQLAQSRAETAQTLAKIPAETAAKVQATVAPGQSSN